MKPFRSVAVFKHTIFNKPQACCLGSRDYSWYIEIMTLDRALEKFMDIDETKLL